MPQNDGEVRVEITGDSSKIKKELKETESAVKNTTDSIADMVSALEDTSSAGNSFDDIAKIADRIAKSIVKAINETNKLGNSIKNETKSAEKAGDAHENDLNPQIKKTGEEAEKSGGKVSGFSKKLEAVSSAAKKSAAAIKAALNGIKEIAKSAVENYAEYEQLAGGVETLFKDSSDAVQEYAAKAYKTAGLSANEYMETVTGFSASLLQSLGNDTEKAAAVADKAITDMADNANKMGTPMESIQNAYQGFAKDNYAMLDNLKLGYGGTKEEMQRLLEDAEKFSGIKYDISSYADIVEAIHVIQGELEISGRTAEEAAEIQKRTGREVLEQTGTTAKEAATTVQGSLTSVKAAWQNLLTGIADENADFGTLIDSFAESAATALDNLLPRVQTSLEGIGELVTELSPVIAEAIPELVSDVLPSVVQAAADLVATLVNALADNGGTIADTALDILDMLVNALTDNVYDITDGAIAIITTLVNSISARLPDLIPAAVEIVRQVAYAIVDNLDEIYESAEKTVDTLLNELVKSIPDVIEFAVVLCEKIAMNLLGFDWEPVGENLFENVSKAINDALHGQAGYTDTVLEESAKRIESYSKYTADRLDAMISTASQKLDEYNAVLTQGKENSYYDVNLMPQWMRIAYENSGKELEQFLSDNMLALEQNISEYTAARQNVMDDLNAPIDTEYSGTNNGAKIAAEAMADEYTKKYQKAQKASEDGAIDLAEQEKENLRLLQDGWENLEHEYSVGAIATEAELYDKKKALWNEYGDASLKDHWKYIEDISKYDRDFAEEQIKLAQKEADEKQRIQDEENKKAEAERKASVDRQEKIVSDGLSEILKTYEKAFDDLEKKRESYRKKLMSVGGDLFSIDVTKDKNGRETTTYTVNNINEQLKKMREFHSQITKLKKQGASEALLSELFALDDEDAAQFAKYLSGMSASEFAKVNELYNKKQELADELSNDLYASEAKKLSDSMFTALDELSAPSADYGKEAADSYIDAFKAEFEERSDEFAKLFEGTDFSAEIKAAVESEMSRYSAAAYTSPAVQSGSDTSAAAENNKKYIDELAKSINKPIQLVLDGKVISEIVIGYQAALKKQTGG